MTDRTTGPIFLIGSHRSGTTVLRYILDAHPRLCCPPESKFIGGVKALVEYPQALRALESLGCGRQQLLAELRRLVEVVFDCYSRSVGKSRWIDKTPNYYKMLPFIDELFGDTPVFIFIVRHPFDTVYSLDEMFATGAIEDPDVADVVARFGRTHSGWARYWCIVNDTICRYWRSHREKALLIKYEDLVTKPMPTMRAVLDFLGEPFPEGLLEAAFIKEHRWGFEDPKARMTTGIHQCGLRRWSGWSQETRGALWSIVDAVAVELGYVRE
jgi:hypothetical protein